MNNFSFGTDQSFVNTSKAPLKGGDIHKVKFLGATFETFEGKQAATQGQKFNVYNIKFENDEGYYTETIFEPREEDYKRRESDFGDNKIINPSRAEEIQLIMAQLVEAVNPGGMATLAGKEIKSFESLCKYITDLTKDGIGKEVNIKLILNKEGKARLPFLSGLTKPKPGEQSRLYPRTNYIGEDLFFTDKELAQINKILESTPTDTGALLEERSKQFETPSNSNDDLNLDLGGL